MPMMPMPVPTSGAASPAAPAEPAPTAGLEALMRAQSVPQPPFDAAGAQASVAQLVKQLQQLASDIATQFPAFAPAAEVILKASIDGMVQAVAAIGMEMEQPVTPVLG